MLKILFYRFFFEVCDLTLKSIIMKKLALLLLVGILPLVGFSQDNLARWVSSDFSATIDNSQVTASNISVSGGVVLTSETWGSDNIFFSTSNGGGYDSALNTAKYRQFHITAIAGYTVTPSSFSFKGRNQGGTSK